MRRASLLVLLGASFLLPYLASPAARPKTKAKSNLAASASRKTGKTTVKSGSSSRAGKAVAAKSRTTRESRGRNGRVVATRLVRTKSGRLARVVVHAPPAPTYQTHPDPDRYIEIQKALADRGYFKGEPNGEWGDDSSDALRRFQAGSNLPDDGKISALTLNGLGLGPRHDGSTASSVPLPSAAVPAPIGSTMGNQTALPLVLPASPASPPNR